MRELVSATVSSSMSSVILLGCVPWSSSRCRSHTLRASSRFERTEDLRRCLPRGARVFLEDQELPFPYEELQVGAGLRRVEVREQLHGLDVLLDLARVAFGRGEARPDDEDTL